jgi:hypothetical protein
MPRTLCVVRSSAPKRMRRDRLQATFPVVLPSRTFKRTNWNAWIVTCSIIIVVAIVLFLEHYIRGLTVHSILPN